MSNKKTLHHMLNIQFKLLKFKYCLCIFYSVNYFGVLRLVEYLKVSTILIFAFFMLLLVFIINTLFFD